MQECCWVASEGGVLTSEIGPCRLMVATIGGMSRFLVYRRAPDALGHPPLLLQSGTQRDATTAMAAAEAAAARIAATSGVRPETRR